MEALLYYNSAFFVFYNRFILPIYPTLFMSVVDWLVLGLSIGLIICYGVLNSRGIKSIDGFLMGNRSFSWYHVGFSVMATQASAITFLSAPGLAYSSGMSFVQFYFGLPLAMIVLCITFVPIFHRLKVYTAYEFLEKRFDIWTRGLTAILFLIQRGISTGITIFAPSIILSTILELDVTYTTLLIGLIVVLYTTYGGTKAVSYSQLLQMSIIFAALLVAGIMVIHLLPADVGFSEALHIAGKSGKTNAIDFSFDLTNQYTVWTGLIGGFFLQLSYFGTDQSQVGRYLTGSSVKESRLGLLMNGLLKIPMQFAILLIGVLVFTYYQYNKPPLFFNAVELKKVENGPYKAHLSRLETRHSQVYLDKKNAAARLTQNLKEENETAIGQSRQELRRLDQEAKTLRKELEEVLLRNDPKADVNDNNYVFLSFVTSTFPKGLIGLVIAVIFLASMGATASAINSLTSTTVVDIYKRFIQKEASDQNYLKASRYITLAWGIFVVGIALFASKLGNLLEAVNILGSLFYGTILGIFLVAFYIKYIGGRAVFVAALLAECVVFAIWFADIIPFLWLNLIGCFAVIVLGYILQFLRSLKTV